MGTAWTLEGDASVAVVGSLRLRAWPEEEGYSFEVRRRDETLIYAVGCRDCEEATLAAAMWALGYYRRSGAE